MNFEGTIGRTLADSEPHFMEPPHPGDDAPNVVIVLLDDTGFAQFGCDGSDIETPAPFTRSRSDCPRNRLGPSKRRTQQAR